MKKGLNKGFKDSNIISKEQKEILDYLTVDFLTPNKIASIRKTSVQAVYKSIKKLEKKGIVKKIGQNAWRQIKPPFSLGTMVEKPTTNLHALQINFPILRGQIEGSDWTIKERLNHWLPKYKNLSILGGLTLKNNNNKSLTVFAKTRNIENLNEIYNLAFKIRTYIGHFFKNQGVVLDIFNCQVKNLNIATEDKQAEGMISKGEKFELDLKKKSEKIFEKDNINAKAWLDGSPFKFTTESNDMEWKRAYLGMPFTIRDMVSLLHQTNKEVNYLAVNINSHIPAIVKLGDNADLLGVQVKRMGDNLEKFTEVTQLPKPKKPKQYGLTEAEMKKLREM